MAALDILLFALLALLFALSAFFSGSETALTSLTVAQRLAIKAKNPAADARIEKCLADRAILFSTLLVGNTLVNFAIATIGYRLFAKTPGGHGWLAIPVMTVLLLAFGEITPKRLALRYAETLAPLCAGALAFWYRILSPFNQVLKFASRAFSPALRRERRALSDPELVALLETAAEKGVIQSEDAEQIAGVLRLSELSASDEMTPRVDIEGCDLDLPKPERDARVAAARHRYLPVYRRTPDAIEGVLDRETGELSDALFVPESVTLDDLLRTFGKSGKNLAVVLDEYGGTAGIITPGDALELILGPTVFSLPGAEPALIQRGQTLWEIDGRASLEEINRTLDVELEAGDADRLAGWVAFHAERLPHVGQVVEADGCRATVLKRRGHRVVLVELEVLARPEPDSDRELIAETDEAVARTEEDDA